MRHPISRLVIASHNQGKIREIHDLLNPLGVRVFAAPELGLQDVEETGTSFAENALLKAISAADQAQMPALSDDSGLAVDALGGAPGIYSARWAERDDGKRDFGFAIQKLHQKMQEAGGNNKACFICALALAFPNDKTTHVYEGKVEGKIVWLPRGDKGFGYDPVFVAKGDKQTFAEIEPEEKHAKSHRAKAFAKFLNTWFPDKI